MITYLSVNAVLSLVALIGASTLMDAPPRLRLWFCLLALFAWLVPWNAISVDLHVATSINWLEINSHVTHVLASSENAILPNTVVSNFTFSLFFTYAFWAACGLGWIGFSVRLIRWHSRIKTLSVDSQDRSDLWRSIGTDECNVPIRVAPGLANAFVTGYVKPCIWLSDEMLSSPALKSILFHEYTHIQRHDNAILLFVALIRDTFWWNPLVILLAILSRQYVEISCDQVCSQHDRRYRNHLAQVLLEPSRWTSQTLISSLSLRRNFNVSRIRLLDKDFHMKPRYFVAVGLMVCVGLTSIALPVLSQQPDDSVIITELRIVTMTDEGEGVLDTQFVGDIEAAKLASLAQGIDAEVSERMTDSTHRSIEIRTSSNDATNYVLEAFDGTEMEGLFRREDKSDWELRGEPLLIDMNVVMGLDDEIFDGTLAANSSDWTGIDTSDYLVRIKPTLLEKQIMPGVGDGIRYDIEVSVRSVDGYRVVARPRLLTEMGKCGSVSFSTTPANRLVLKFKTRKPS